MNRLSPLPAVTRKLGDEMTAPCNTPPPDMNRLSPLPAVTRKLGDEMTAPCNTPPPPPPDDMNRLSPLALPASGRAVTRKMGDGRTRIPRLSSSLARQAHSQRASPSNRCGHTQTHRHSEIAVICRAVFPYIIIWTRAVSATRYYFHMFREDGVNQRI
ncbi:hypothetical protein RRG08_023884 [Elysia crispata]|uniref:Uncharacterized protein n=1 Tax=Elysia crispata TaxID=231223 RepID=A0AAE1AT85_9GAST|nr:hypothetical protein RRG08_023884 [Elysia crispata]